MWGQDENPLQELDECRGKGSRGGRSCHGGCRTGECLEGSGGLTEVLHILGPAGAPWILGVEALMEFPKDLGAAGLMGVLRILRAGGLVGVQRVLGTAGLRGSCAAAVSLGLCSDFP